MRAQKVGKRAAKSGMDFSSADAAIENIHSELNELSAAAADSESKERLADEMGDILFSCVNAARKMGLNAEECLTAATEKFIRRFSAVEKITELSGRKMNDYPPEELDKIWNEVKHNNS